MSISRRLRNFASRGWPDWWLLLQAYVGLGITRLAIKTLRFNRLANSLGEHRTESPAEASQAQLAEAKRVSWAVRRASSLTPWKSNCFPQAMTAQYLLRRRRIMTTLYFGVRLDGDEDMKAHAWLRCGRYFVTGGPGHLQYGVVATFADQKAA